MSDRLSPESSTDVVAAHIAYGLKLLVPADGVFEVRGLQLRPELKDETNPRTVVGYVRGDRVPQVAKRIAALSERVTESGGVYFTPQAVASGVLSRSSHHFAPVTTDTDGNGERVTRPLSVRDDDVTGYRYLPIDIDTRRAAGFEKHSATDAEKAAAYEVAARVREFFAGCRWPAPLVIDSGNGWHLYYALPEGVTKDQPPALLARLAHKFDCDAAAIDASVGTRPHIMKIPGTISKKGPNTPERPHRRSGVVEAEKPANWRPGPIPLKEWTAEPVAKVIELLPAPPPKAEPVRAAAASHPVNVSGGTSRLGRAALRDECSKVRGSPNGERNKALNKSAYKIGRLVGGGEINREDAERELHAAGLASGMAEARVRKSLASGLNAGMKNPRFPEPNAPSQPPAVPPLHADGSLVPDASPSPPTAVDDALNEHDDDPHKLARALLGGYQSKGRRTLAFWRGEFHQWDGCRYRTPSASRFRAYTNRCVRSVLEFHHRLKMDAHEPDGDTELPKMPKVPDVLVGNVLAALQGMCLVGAGDDVSAPCWINDHDGPDPRDLVATGAGLVHLPAYADGKPNAILPNTPDYLNFNTTGFTPDPNAPEPKEWLAFLGTLWPNDPDTISRLQEWFGYLLTPDTSRQKILLLIGPPRSGKGTIARVLQELVGVDNFSNPTLSKLGTQFGLSSSLGKSVILVEDARLSTKADLGMILERLLTICGEGRIEVERKNKESVNGKLNGRFVLAANEIPKLFDSTGAVEARLSPVNFTISFIGREDLGLSDRLLTELPGIFNWAVVGWKRLREQGVFTAPASAVEVLDEFKESNNPVVAFVQEKCELGAEYWVWCADLFKHWRSHCEEVGRKNPGTLHDFGRLLKDATKGNTRRKQKRDTANGGRQFGCYEGIRPKDASDDATTTEDELSSSFALPFPDLDRNTPTPSSAVIHFGEGEM